MKRLCTLLSFAIVSLIAFSANPDLWDGETITPFDSEGKGTQENPILIESAAQLAYLAQETNKGISEGGSDFENLYFKLTTDIDLDNYEWTPIGWHVTTANNRHFKGHFDGDGHVITNLSITDDAASVYSTCALFGVSNGGTIKNVGVGEGSAITVGSIVGGIVANKMGGRIDNCFSLAILEGTSYAGGIVGYTTAAPYISNCYNRGDVAVRTVQLGERKIGGILGATTTAWISYCYNTGIVAAKGIDFGVSLGGICGNHQATRKPTKCFYLEGVVPTNANTWSPSMEESIMKSQVLLDSLNGDQYPLKWVADTENINDGYPLLWWQVENSTFVSSMDAPSLDMLEQNCPNPTSGLTRIAFSTLNDEKVSIRILNVKGMEIAVPVNGSYPQGRHTIEFDTEILAPGIYFYQMNHANKTITKKMIVIK